MLKNDPLLERIDDDWRTAGLDAKREAMLAYAVKLTRTPGSMVEADVDALRSVGFSDRDVLDICEVTSYYAYVNRIADGLGVMVEDWYPPDPEPGHWPGPEEA